MKPVVTRRMYRRVSTEYPSCYLLGQVLRQSIIRDISLNGVRIQSLSDLPRNPLVMIRLWLPDQQDSLDIDQAIVRWVRGQEFGVQFVSLSNEADFRLAAHIERVLEQQPVTAAV
ncbi:MAG: PilZ domain-containing protein [Nitrospira sp.]|nr:PilZ domain-containing protein [Nitrospira sp.]MDH4370557.1 PilZ domain-containing protein [Nitrospira sp.]MDH5348315.1 PilZ domain-containing protein [Nitrospira sp.]MDH5497889.1 PilZ domain-containing protein [Nitrospira sp.]MDH5724959.1 PilZ domain-containing protein [Nitrospira sp.]